MKPASPSASCLTGHCPSVRCWQLSFIKPHLSLHLLPIPSAWAPPTPGFLSSSVLQSPGWVPGISSCDLTSPFSTSPPSGPSLQEAGGYKFLTCRYASVWSPISPLSICSTSPFLPLQQLLPYPSEAMLVSCGEGLLKCPLSPGC